MTTLHAQLIGDKAVLPRTEFERLVELARRSEEIELQMDEADLPTVGIMRLAEQGKAFDWLADDEEDLYTINDLKVRYR
ncbi:MAG: hypothetical protein ACRERD_34245 [Candidatus Binatia bacterium]